MTVDYVVQLGIEIGESGIQRPWEEAMVDVTLVALITAMWWALSLVRLCFSMFSINIFKLVM